MEHAATTDIEDMMKMVCKVYAYQGHDGQGVQGILIRDMMDRVCKVCLSGT